MFVDLSGCALIFSSPVDAVEALLVMPMSRGSLVVPDTSVETAIFRLPCFFVRGHVELVVCRTFFWSLMGARCSVRVPGESWRQLVYAHVAWFHK